MKNTLKILALGAALAASATMAKADPVLGSGYLNVQISACDATTSGCATSGQTPTGILFTPPILSELSGGSLSEFTLANSSFGDPTNNPYVAYDFPANTVLFTVEDTSNGDVLTFTTDSVGEHDVYTGGNTQDFYDTGTLTLTNSSNVVLGSSLGYVAVSNDTFFFQGGTATLTPEPSSLALLGTGLLGLAGIARRKFASRFSA